MKKLFVAVLLLATPTYAQDGPWAHPPSGRMVVLDNTPVDPDAPYRIPEDTDFTGGGGGTSTDVQEYGSVAVGPANPFDVRFSDGTTSYNGASETTLETLLIATEDIIRWQLDYDTGGPSVTQVVLGLALPGAGGPVAGGTSTNPIRTDPTGTTAQPVSGTVTANLATGSNVIGAIAAGNNNIGDVDVASIGAGDNNIGNIDVLTLPAIPTGTNSIGTVQPGNTANTIPWLTRHPHGARTDTYTAAANGTTVSMSSTPARHYGIEVSGTGAGATAWNVRLECSLDNTNFTTMLTHTEATGDGVILWSDTNVRPCLYFRSKCVSVTLGSATNIQVDIVGMQ